MLSRALASRAPALGLLACLGLLAGLAGSAWAGEGRAGESWAGEAWALGSRCPPGTVSPRDQARCLADAVRLSETSLQAALDMALAAVEARADLAPSQRARWKSQLQEAQSRFLLYRNFDCQSVAPYEGGRAIGNFERRAVCLVLANERRAEDMHARYDAMAAAPLLLAAPVVNSGTRPGTWLQGVSRPVD